MPYAPNKCSGPAGTRDPAGRHGPAEAGGAQALDFLRDFLQQTTSGSEFSECQLRTPKKQQKNCR